MRIRQVKPEFWRDAKLHRMPLEQKAVYIGLWQEADDAGWLRWEPRQIVIDILGDWPEPAARALLNRTAQALVRRGRLIRFPCGHAFIPTLAKNQHLAGATRRVTTFEREHAKCVPAAGPQAPRGEPAAPPPGKVSEGKVSEVKGSEGKVAPASRIQNIDGRWEEVQ